ncbi:tetratricopeptide repeat protein [Muriicola sp. Z0-33]|uniref:ATP-binding protein n=1 Tax=Muriicola sp. Z0-33 TaxID=2816957 RepID=UPI00223912F9|nr:tetratricopeptide repeat protein [Muriicola sp. Z0-33]MCW5517313.1 tetratricopeptide repeat protein [Muriicola sp. Z0-33]
MTTTYLKIYTTLLCLLTSVIVSAQNEQVTDSLLKLLELTDQRDESNSIKIHLSKLFERQDIDKSRQFAMEVWETGTDSLKAEAANQIGRSYFYQNQLDSATSYFKRSVELLQKIELPAKASAVMVSFGATQLRKGEYKEALETLIEGVKYFESVGDSINMGKCYNNIASAFGELGDTQKSISYGKAALTIFDQYQMIPYKAVTLPNLAGQYVKLGDTETAKKYFLEAEQLASSRNDKFALARIYNNLGNMYLETDPDLSESYLTKGLEIKLETGNSDGIGTLYNNLGYLLLNKGEPRKAIPYFLNAIDFGQGTNASTIYNNLSDAYKALGNYKQALIYAERKNAISDSLAEVTYQKTIAEISTKYETEKKEKEILSLQNTNLQTDFKRKQNRNLLYASLGFLAVSLIIAFSILKNSKKRRIIAEQKQELESQKVKSLLNEIELVGIDSMIEGQEKERQRIAEDLHDSLGAKLAALKLFVADIKTTNKTVHTKIKGLLDESYTDLRNIALQKNASAAIDKGLIPAVNKVADQLKSTNKLNIEVINIDLHRNIKDYIELQLFRIMQELLTNTIKHANAQNVSIQFSEDNDSLVVVYEDDGIGFDTGRVNKGQGFINIGNRLQKINGTYTVDSTPSDGSTVIINVPI